MRTTARLDLLYWALCLGYVVMTLLTGWPSYKAWAVFALAPCLLGVAWAGAGLLRPGSLPRAAPLLVACAASAVALASLAVRRAAGDITMSLSEVRVVERMARQLLSTGSPYLDTTLLSDAVVFDYSPYTPAMAVFGLPSALLGTHAWTDARIYSLLVAVAAVLLALRLHPPRSSVTAWQLVLNPLVLLMAAASGTDIGVLGLVVLGLVLAGGGRAGWAGACLALAMGMKLTAAPILLIAGALLWVRGGGRAAGRAAVTAALTTALLHVPVLLAAPAAYVDNVIRFPAGLTPVASSAAGPLPGHLLSELGELGRVVALVLVATTAAVLAAWVVLRPPPDLRSAFTRSAVALTAAMLVLPASRVGYAIYPLTLWGAALLWPGDADARDDDEPATARTASRLPV